MTIGSGSVVRGKGLVERWVERSLAKAVAPFLALDVVVSEAGGDMPTLTRFRRSRPAVGSRGRLDFFGAEPSEAAATGGCWGVRWVGGWVAWEGARGLGCVVRLSAGTLCWWGCEHVVEESRKPKFKFSERGRARRCTSLRR